nr:Chain E, phage-derived peptide 419 [synthetic construct]4EJF_F Chain F, phage-derived peptide 419 [synthetic construct]4EJF_G Chain G, phage-derived peptide 419 [synthetic construct]4EJF_H Chain H, phage-derived peptide 419 [synthetic construct]
TEKEKGRLHCVEWTILER